MVEKKKVDPQVKRANLSFLQLIFPSFLLVILAVGFERSIALSVIEILVFLYQYYLIQQFVNSMYN